MAAATALAQAQVHVLFGGRDKLGRRIFKKVSKHTGNN
jgi:hypothetical protein